MIRKTNSIQNNVKRRQKKLWFLVDLNYICSSIKLLQLNPMTITRSELNSRFSENIYRININSCDLRFLGFRKLVLFSEISFRLFDETWIFKRYSYFLELKIFSWKFSVSFFEILEILSSGLFASIEVVPRKMLIFSSKSMLLLKWCP